MPSVLFAKRIADRLGIQLLLFEIRGSCVLFSCKTMQNDMPPYIFCIKNGGVRFGISDEKSCRNHG